MSQTDAQRILDSLRQSKDAMVALLVELAEMESPSSDAASQQPLLSRLSQEFASLGFRCRRTRGLNSAGQILAVPRNAPPKSRRQMLLGHCDTVWPIGTVSTMPVAVDRAAIPNKESDKKSLPDRGVVRGPGVYDMKAGLVQGLFALRAIAELEIETPVTPIFFISTDEEIGSPESVDHVLRLARIVDRVFVLEPSLGPRGLLKTARKGVSRFSVRVTGKPAHAGLDPEKGVSAILEMARVIESLHRLNDPEDGISVNVGTIHGGTSANVIAAECRIEVDVRTRTIADAERIEQSIMGISPSLAGTRIEAVPGRNRPPLESTPRNRVLWHQALEAAEQLGLEIDEGIAGGGSDGNYTSLHAATLDGLGAVGEGAHAVNEQVVIDRMPERAALLACLLTRGPLFEKLDPPK